MEKYQVSKNILYNFLGQGILLLLGIFTLPIIIQKLGKENFGIFILITSVVGYFSILDFGFGLAIVKNLSEALSKKDFSEVRKIVATSFLFFLLIGFLGTGLIILAAEPIVNNFLHIPKEIISSAKLAFYIGSFSFFINMLGTVFIGILSSLQRMDIINSRNVLLGILNALGTIVLLFLGYGLVSVMLWNILISALALLIFFIVIKKAFPQISLSLGFDKKAFLSLFKFGGFKFISNVSGQIIFQLDRFLIGIFQPISALAFYSPPLSLVQKGFSSLINISSASFPAVSSSHALGDQKRIQELYIRISRLTAFIMFPFLAFLFVGAREIIRIWLGEEFVLLSSKVLRILALSYFFITATTASVTISEAVGNPKIPALFGTLGAVINLASALILIPKFGIIGAAWAFLINCVLTVPIFVGVVSRKIVKISIFEVLNSSYLKPAVSALLSSVILFLLLKINLLIGAVFFGIVYIALNILLNTFDEKDKKAFIYFRNIFLKKEQI